MIARGPRPLRPVRQPLPIDPWFRRLPGCHDLLLALAQEPWDDVRRSELACWLDGHGEIARAEYLRLHAEPRRPRRAEEKHRIEALEGEHGQAWLSGLPPGAYLVGGLAAGFHVEGGNWKEDLEAAFRAVDVQQLGLTGIGDEGVRALAPSPWLGQVTSLGLWANEIGDEGAKALAGSPHLGQLDSLHLFDNWIGDDGVAALASSPYLGQLISLSLWGNRIGPTGAMALAGSPQLRRLTSLELSDNKIGDEGARALAASPYLGQLTSLGLWGNEIGDDGARDLAAAACLGRLDSLHLFDNRIGDEGAKALAASPYLHEFISISLSGNRMGDEGKDVIRRRFLASSM